MALICLMFSMLTLVACSRELTTKDLYGVLDISYEYDDVKTGVGLGGRKTGETTLHVTVYPAVPGKFYNASVQVKFELPDNWYLSENGTENQEVVHWIDLDSEGRGSASFSLKTSYLYRDPPSGVFFFPNDMRGTFKPE